MARQPPIKRAPHTRHCASCGKRLRPRYRRVDAEGNVVWQGAVAREWTGLWEAYGEFCTRLCATRWANAVLRRYPQLRAKPRV